MSVKNFLILGAVLSGLGCQAYNPHVKNDRREFYIEPTDIRSSFVYEGDIRNSQKKVYDHAYRQGFEVAKKKYSVDGKGGFYPHHKHQEMQLRFVPAKNYNLGGGIKLDKGSIPVMVNPVTWMESVGEPLPGMAEPVVVKKEEVIEDVMSGEMIYE